MKDTFIYGVKYERFEKVDKQELVVGTKYLFKSHPSSTTYYSGIFKEHHDTTQLFDSVIFHTCYISSQPVTRGFNKQLYYRFVSKKEQIQQDMEQRALTQILKRLVNDDFTW